MSNLNCPYCDAELEVNHDEGQGYEEGVLHQMQCEECDKYFVFETSILFHYEPEKADCLNDGNHIYKPQHTYPSFFTKMKCQTCDHTRVPTQEERIKFNIPTHEEFLKEREGDL